MNKPRYPGASQKTSQRVTFKDIGANQKTAPFGARSWMGNIFNLFLFQSKTIIFMHFLDYCIKVGFPRIKITSSKNSHPNLMWN